MAYTNCDKTVTYYGEIEQFYVSERPFEVFGEITKYQVVTDLTSFIEPPDNHLLKHIYQKYCLGSYFKHFNITKKK